MKTITRRKIRQEFGGRVARRHGRKTKVMRTTGSSGPDPKYRYFRRQRESTASMMKARVQEYIDQGYVVV